jgi:Rad3-related DNA helicase/DNA polymerase III epsilon subunit-like protein
MAKLTEWNSRLLSPLLVETRPAGELEIDADALSRFVAATGQLAVVDLETTGLSDDPAAEILEFGAVLFEPGARSITTVESLVRPRDPLPLTISHLTGLTDADVAEAPTIDEVSKQIERVLEGRTLIAHNADFERYFLTRFVSSALGEYRYLDTQDFLAISHPDAADLRLETFARSLLHREERHRALSDALDTACVMSRAAAGVAAGEHRYAVARHALEAYAPESPWLALFCGDAPLVAEDPRSQFAEIPTSCETPVAFDEDAIVAALSDVDRGRRYFPGYRVREQQLELARHFVRNLQSGGRLLLEGGTGVGKSLAYLAAAIPYAMERAAGGIRDPIVISTRTKLLQDQLLTKDIPAAAAMFGYPDLKAVSIKGRANYLCARRAALVLAEGREPQMFAADRLAYAALAACAGIRRHGEVGALPGGLHYRFPPLRDLARRAVAARAEQCSREQCATHRDCPFGKRRAALAKAHLVVANHDLLLRWPPDYPTFGDAIIDEAQELSGVVDEVYALEVNPLEVLEAIDDLFGRPSDGRRGAGLLGRSSLRELEGDVRAWRRGIQQDFVALGRCLADRASEFGEVQLPSYPDRVLPQATALAQTAAERLLAAADAADRIAQSRGLAEEDLLAIARITDDLRAAADALRGAFAGGSDDAVAAFERLEPPFDRWRLAVRAVSPADAFHQRFAERLETLACVSASLFVAGDPFAALGELEIERHGEPPVTRVSVASPFPYAKHMRVVALESEGNLVEETSDVLADLARLLGGRTLGLFTSLRRMREVSDLLAERLRGEGYEILMPRRASDDPAALVERFTRAGGGMILLGARSFWQGLDIPGPALQAVVIEKLPFEVPTELRKRRELRLRAAGEDAFGRYTMGKMLLNLKQMSGRLIRSEEDRGLIVIVEGRSDRGYFGRLQEAFPPDAPVQVARREELAGLIAEVGIETARRATLRGQNPEER